MRAEERRRIVYGAVGYAAGLTALSCENSYDEVLWLCVARHYEGLLRGRYLIVEETYPLSVAY